MLYTLLVLPGDRACSATWRRAARWLIGTAVALGFAFLTMEASFIFGGAVRHLPGAGVGRAAVGDHLAGRTTPEPRRQSFRILVVLIAGR